MEDPLRARLILALFALSAVLVACLTATPLSNTQSISGLVSLNANQASGATQASSLQVGEVSTSPNSAALADIIPGRLIVKFKSGLGRNHSDRFRCVLRAGRCCLNHNGRWGYVVYA